MSEENTAFHATPEVLTWARREWKLTVEEAARRAMIPPEVLLRAEQSADKTAMKITLTVAEARRLAALYQRQLAVFLLPEPPYDYEDGSMLFCPRCGRKLPEVDTEVTR